MKNILNKKGDIALTVTLVLTVVLLLAGLYTFVTDNRNFGAQSKEIAIMYNTLNFNENYIKTEIGLIANEVLLSGVEDSELKNKTKEIALNYNMSLESEGNLFAKIQNGDFRFENVSNEYIFEISGIGIKSRVGDNQVFRKIDYSIKLNRPDISS